MNVDVHVEFIAATIGSLAVVALLEITYVIALLRNRGLACALSAVRRKLCKATSVVVPLLYSPASSAVSSTFLSDSLDDSRVNFSLDYRIKYNSSKRRVFWRCMKVMITVNSFGIPFLIAFLFFCNHKLHIYTSLRNDNSDMAQLSTFNIWNPYKP